MAQVSFAEVLHLAEQLSREEQKALIEHLTVIAKERELSIEEKRLIFASAISSHPVVEFSNRREDWYGDDER